MRTRQERTETASWFLSLLCENNIKAWFSLRGRCVCGQYLLVNFKGSPITLATLCAPIWNLCFMFKQLLDYAGQRIMFLGPVDEIWVKEEALTIPNSKFKNRERRNFRFVNLLILVSSRKCLWSFLFSLSLFFHWKTKNKSFTVNHKWMKVSCNFPQKSFSTLNFQSSLFANELNLRGRAKDEFTLRFWFITFCRWLRRNLSSNLM